MPSNISLIRGLHVQSGLFSSGADFALFCPLGKNSIPHRASIVFGRNGSGKTTISQQIHRIAEGDDNEGFFWGDGGSPVPLTSQDRQAIRVFNEKYIQETVSFREEGLETIVMLGDTVQAQKRIDEIDEELIAIDEKFTEWNTKKERAERGPESLVSILAKAKNEAKGGGWSDRCENITGKRSKLTEQKWLEVVAAETDLSRREIETEYTRKLAQYQRAEDVGSETIAKISLIDEKRYDEATLVEFLNKTLDEPILTEREERIFALVQNGNQKMVEYAREIASNEEISSCPLCQQELTPEYKESLKQSVLRVLNEEADSFKKNLEDHRIFVIEEEELGLDKIPEDMLLRVREALKKVNGIIAQYTDLIQKRLQSLYKPAGTKPLGLVETVALFNVLVSEVNKKIDDLNDAVRNREALKQQLLNLNNQMAWIDAKNAIKLYEKSKKELGIAAEELEKVTKKRSKLEEERRAEEAKMSMTSLAANVINDFLATIFFDSSRFVLVPYSNVYKIESHGKPVRPHEISTGERNILALCYFFSESGRMKFEGAEDSDPQYIILDDPVSSFDMENRVGICSRIRDRAAHILQSNPDSLITIMTHDIGIAAELKHTLDDLSEVCKGTQSGFIADSFELCGDATCNLPMKKSRYSILLKRAFDYASSEQENEDESYVIGNILRRILEGYSSFNYGIGIERLSRDKDLAVRFGPAARFFKSVMYRLALNDESHLKESLDALNPPLAFDRYSYQEKVAIAQCVFVMLDYLDGDHIVKQLTHFGISRDSIEMRIAEWRRRFTPVDKTGDQ